MSLYLLYTLSSFLNRMHLYFYTNLFYFLIEKIVIFLVRKNKLQKETLLFLDKNRKSCIKKFIPSLLRRETISFFSSEKSLVVVSLYYRE